MTSHRYFTKAHEAGMGEAYMEHLAAPRAQKNCQQTKCQRQTQSRALPLVGRKRLSVGYTDGTACSSSSIDFPATR